MPAASRPSSRTRSNDKPILGARFGVAPLLRPLRNETTVTKRSLVPILFAVQCCLVAILCFGDIGFDHPGRFGLDFGDAIRLIAIYLCILVAGTIVAGVQRRWKWLTGQLLFPVLVYASANALATYKPRYRASEFQHLVGMSKAEVHGILGRRSKTTSGAMSSRVAGKIVECEFESYNGMTVYYQRDGTVIAVEPPNKTKFLDE